MWFFLWLKAMWNFLKIKLNFVGTCVKYMGNPHEIRGESHEKFAENCMKNEKKNIMVNCFKIYLVLKQIVSMQNLI